MSPPRRTECAAVEETREERRSAHWREWAPLLVGIFLVALNLRPALASVSPVLETIRGELGLGRAAAGLLISLPVACMGLFAPLASRTGARLGPERAIGWAVALIGISTAARLVDGAAALYASALLVGFGAAVVQTLLPGVVKEYFPNRATLVTGLYTSGINLGAAVAAAATAPISNLPAVRWQGSLAFWALPAVVAVAVWLLVSQLVSQRHHATGPSPGSGSAHLPWSSSRGWLVTAVFAATALCYFTILTWLAPLYRDLGWEVDSAGLLLSVFAGVQVFASFLIPAAADRTDDRRPALAATIFTVVVGLLGLSFFPITAPWAPWAWSVLLGLGLGGLFPLALTLPVDHVPSPEAARRLTAMAFIVGYTLAATGPWAAGALRDLTGGYPAPFAALVVLCGVQLLAALALRPPPAS